MPHRTLALLSVCVVLALSSMSVSAKTNSRVLVRRVALTERAQILRNAALARAARLRERADALLEEARSSIKNHSSSSKASIPKSSSSASSAKSIPSDSSALEELRSDILRLVNVQRVKAGIDPLSTSSILSRTAQSYATQMADGQFFSHQDPLGHSSLDRIRDGGYLTAPCDCAWSYHTGENIAHGQVTAAQVMSEWMASPSHKENILNPHYTELGVGFDRGYWVQHFGDVSKS